MESLKQLLDKPARIYLAATGAGAGAQKALWEVPGISSVLVGAELPYAPEALERFLGYRPEHACSPETAMEMAMASFYRACEPGGAPPVGVGLTASVATLKPHRGPHRAFAAIFTDEVQAVWRLTLPKGGPEARERDGLLCDQMVLNLLLCEMGLKPDYEQLASEFQGYGLECHSPRNLTNPFGLTIGLTLAKDSLLKRPFWAATGERLESLPGMYRESGRGAIFPGAFNPPHEGHFGILEAYQRQYGGPVACNLEISPKHKEAVSVPEAVRRIKALRGRDVIVSDGLSLYIDKAERWPGLGIILGADAFQRMVDPYWGPDLNTLRMQFNGLGTCFFVVDRKVGEGVQGVDQYGVTGLNVRKLRGRWDISSTELRMHGKS